VSIIEIKESHTGQMVTWVGAGVNTLLIVCKFVAGILGHSQALVVDVVQSSFSFCIQISLQI
jgi:divalent metal cation (Fe/Co/Zn/Cd) transporter